MGSLGTGFQCFHVLKIVETLQTLGDRRVAQILDILEIVVQETLEVLVTLTYDMNLL